MTEVHYLSDFSIKKEKEADMQWEQLSFCYGLIAVIQGFDRNPAYTIYCGAEPK